jgi:hypothetical protein
MNVHASLSVDAGHGKVLVTFRIENRGERRVWLPREIAADTTLCGNLFDLRAQPDAAPLAYRGPLVKRAAATQADYVELAPHSAHTHTVDITEAYVFGAGMREYAIRYEGQVVTDMRQPDVLSDLVTEAVQFGFDGS